jgi:hypothetical protein
MPKDQKHEDPEEHELDEDLPVDDESADSVTGGRFYYQTKDHVELKDHEGLKDHIS